MRVEIPFGRAGWRQLMMAIKAFPEADPLDVGADWLITQVRKALKMKDDIEFARLAYESDLYRQASDWMEKIRAKVQRGVVPKTLTFEVRR